MKPLRLLCAGAVVAAAVGLARAQDSAPQATKPPDETTLNAIAVKAAKLGRLVESLRRQGLRDPFLAEVEIYHKAATWIVRHNEFFQPDAGAWTLDALDRGLLRASQAAQGESPWLQQRGQAVVRAYRSLLDGSVQPYAVTFPADYGKDPRKKWRLDVVLHGRDASLTEVKFLQQHAGDRPAPKDQDFILLEIYGRGNNAYRWAGEADVREALSAFVAVERLLGREPLLDPRRKVLRGFSMGGAGTWHIGLHHPDSWCVLGPGAGFTTTRGYVKSLPARLPPYQEACLHIYDAVDYAANAFNVPVVAYSGDQDPQMQAARNIEEKLKPLGIPMTHLVAPGLGHQFPPAWRQKAEAEYARHAAKGREEYPERVRFVTYTLKYPSCDWVHLMGLDRHYERAAVEAERADDGFVVKTTNVRTLHLGLPPGPATPQTVTIDGQRLEARPYLMANGSLHLYLTRRDGPWTAVLPERLLTEQVRRPRKSPRLHGPIDDAFTDGFLCVRGTGEAWHAATQQYAEGNLKRFQEEWNKYLRGELPVKDDVDVAPEDIAGKHLVLFGDPASNTLLRHVLDGLPLRWTKEQITLAGQTYAAGEHVPVLIYPSPLNTNRYVVLNSGHTFHAADFRGTNALLYPRLGDYAVLRPAPTSQDPLAASVATAGLFDDDWQVPND
jgi:dienelactone hydrolase